MDEVLISTPREAILRRLDYLDTLVTDADLQSRVALTDTEIARMTTAWRALLDQHQPDVDGRCRQRSGWRRRRKFPCSVWTMAHRHLLATDSHPAGGCGRPTFAGLRSNATAQAAS